MTKRFTKTALLGYPVSHSLSPRLHARWIELYKLRGSYEAVAVPEGDVLAAIKRLVEEGHAGFNVTVPHKETVFGLVDVPTKLAALTGAVNTVWVQEGKLHGTNTDIEGFAHNILHKAPAFDFANSTIVMLGAGGAAKGVGLACCMYGKNNVLPQKIVIANRTQERAQIVAQFISDAFPAMSSRLEVVSFHGADEYFSEADLIVNTTSVGMAKSEESRFPWTLETARPTTIVTDIVYNPLHTNLLKAATQRGLKTITGLGMLLYQAAPGFELWHGVRPEVTQELEAWLAGYLQD